ncbi:MAG: DsbA family protein [Oligoflexia bacterium]|nr:DsbA family protein [Oligoflexia bacterium]
MNARLLTPLVGLLGLASFPAACQTPVDQAVVPAASATADASPSGSPRASTITAGQMAPDTVLASWNGGQITFADLQKTLGVDLTQMEVEYLTKRFTTESQGVDQLLIQKLIGAEAAKRGVSTQDLIKAEVTDKTAAPTDAEIQQMYAAMSRQLRGAPLDQVRDAVSQQVSQRKQTEVFTTWVGALKTAAGAKTSVPFPDMPRFDVSIDDDPMMGAKDAPVTIIQFAEYQCPYCGKANATVKKLLDDYDGKVRMVFRDFPLSFHPNAIPAALAANCADKQGKYWQIHDLMMQNQRSLEEKDLTAYATQVGLDLDQWNTCRKDPATRTEVDDDMAAGKALGITGTPAFFINGIMLSGALPYTMFAQIIDKELEQE